MDFKDLFDRWKIEFKFDAFIGDGIVDVKLYEEPHILFVLRDMNCREERDLCNDLRTDGSGWKTWNNAARWIEALLDGNKEYPESIDKEKRAAQMKRISVMNLKKEGGGSRTDGAVLLEVVKNQRKYIFEEIKLCDPEIIIGCGLSGSGIKGNATLLKEYIFENTSEWKVLKSTSLDREWWYYYANVDGKCIPVIEFCHPQVTTLNKKRGHNLFRCLYNDVLLIRETFIKNDVNKGAY